MNNMTNCGSCRCGVVWTAADIIAQDKAIASGNACTTTHAVMYHNIAITLVIGVFAGACGALVGTPAEVSLIRMTADGR